MPEPDPARARSFEVRCSCGKVAVLRVDAAGHFHCDDPAWAYHTSPDPDDDRDGRLWHCGADGHYQAGLGAHAVEVRFYRANEKPFGCFSNLFRREMEFEGLVFPTAEHAYQYMKSRKPEVRDWLMAAPSPSLLAMAAHGLLSWDIAPGWSKGRRDRMRRVVEAKFRQHHDLAEVLMSTGDARIVESGTIDNEVNRRWGQVRRGGGWVGENWLGIILCEVRDVLRAELAVPGILARAAADTRDVAKGERAGERVDGDTMGFVVGEGG